MLRLMRLQNAARYLEGATIREDGCLRLRFGGCDQEQTRGVPFEYVDAEDEEKTESTLIGQLRQIGYIARRATPAPDPAPPLICLASIYRKRTPLRGRIG